MFQYQNNRNSYQEGDPINLFNPATFMYLSQAITWISNAIYHGLICVQWVQLRWEAIVRFVDIGRIGDHHCLIFLCIGNSETFKCISDTFR